MGLQPNIVTPSEGQQRPRYTNNSDKDKLEEEKVPNLQDQIQ